MTATVQQQGKADAGLADMSYFEMPAFQDAFVHGLSMILGGLFGLFVFVSFQPEPVIKPYAFELVLKEPVKEPIKEPVKMDVLPVVKDSPVIEPTVPAVMPVTPSKIVGGPGDTIRAETLPGSVAADEHKSVAPDAPASTAQEEISDKIVPVETAEEPKAVEKLPVFTAFPAPGMTEKGPYGLLPIMRVTDKARPFDVYRHPFPAADLTKSLVALVVIDVGLSDKLSNAFLQSMPVGTNVIISRQAKTPQEWVTRVRGAGGEVWAELAVEPPRYPVDDPGAYALFSNASIDQNQQALLRQLSAFGGYTGVFARGASPYFTNDQDAEFLSSALFSRGLGLVMNTVQVDPVFKKNAVKEKSAFYQGAMLQLDEPVLADRFIKVAENQARSQGYSILIVPPSMANHSKIKKWISELPDRGVVLVPLSVIAERGLTLMPGR